MSADACPRCGQPLPSGARFCPNCGFPVGAPAPEERKVVTVVFTDLVGSTRLSSSIDPEAYREVIAAYYQVVTEELAALGGQAYNFAGDAVVGVFGLPQTHADDALRAIRAGVRVVERVSRIGATLGLPVPLRVRVGANTGLVAIGSEAAERGLLFGAVVNAAARLQQAAEPDTVVAGETTWLLTRDHVQFGERREIEAKGFDEALLVYPVVSLTARAPGRPIAFVDRRRELRLLTDTLERATESRRAHLVTLVGEPGIGKSRLVEEFLEGLPDTTRVLRGRSSSFDEDVTFAALGQMLLQHMGVRAGTPPDELRARLEEIVGECCPVDEAKQVAARLGLVLGIGDESRADRRYRVGEIRAGLLSFLEGLARSGPVVLVFEDMHLADPPLLDVVEHVVREGKQVPLLVVVVARFELLDERPEWGGGLGDSVTLYVEPMSLEDAVVLAREAGDGLDESTAERVARHAGGNPFFIVETTSMLLHRRAEMPPDAAPLPGLLLPPTVQAVIAARIDHLPSEARDLVRKASVFARPTFDVSELALICEPEERVLKLLEEEELLARDEERPQTWRFRHGLVRDVAYDSLPKRERLRLHNAVADGLEADPETAARYPRAIAYHRERAAREALDLDPRDRSLADRAVAALVRAADVALIDSSEPRPAADLYERALALSGPERTWGAEQAGVLAHLGEARYWLGDFDAALVPLRNALEIGADEPAIRAHASRFLGDIELSVRGNVDAAIEHFDSALAAARQQGDPRTLARTLLQAAWAPYWRDDLATARAMVEEALEIARSAPGSDPWAEARALITLGVFVERVGDQEDVLALARHALAIAESSGDRFSEATAREVVGNTLRRMMRLDEAMPHLDASVRLHRDLGARWELASALTSRGNVHRLAGRTEASLRDLREAFKIFRELQDRSQVSWTASSLARVLAAAGDVASARQVLQEAAAVTMAEADLRSDLLLAESAVLWHERDREAALERATSALSIERARGLDRSIAAVEWWVGRLFGADVIGGRERLEHVRKVLEDGHQVQALREPDLLGA